MEVYMAADLSTDLNEVVELTLSPTSKACPSRLDEAEAAPMPPRRRASAVSYCISKSRRV